MIKNRKVWSYLLFVFIIFGCTEENTYDIPDIIEKKDIVINNNIQDLNRRIIKRKQPVPVIPFVQKHLKSGGYANAPDMEDNFSFTLIAEALSPTYEGLTIQATHVDIKNSYAFVSFNMRGPEYLGGVQVFDVSDPNSPLVISEAIFPNIDVSAIEYDNFKLYLAGAYDPSVNDTTYLTPAVIDILNLNPSMQITGTDTIIDIDSYVATDIKITDAGGEMKISCTTGDNGGLVVYDLISLKKDSIFELTDARAVDAYNDKLFVLKNNPGEVVMIENAAITSQMALGSNLTPGSKSEMAINEHGIFTAMNAEGLQYLNSSGTLKQHIPKPDTPEGEPDENYVTNSISVNDGLVLIGNGGAGSYVGTISEQHNDSIVLLGTMGFEDKVSVNFAYAEENLVFVASGLGGLKILTYEYERPYELKTCKTTIIDIESFLPENVNSQERHPEYFADTLHTNVILTKESNVYISFLHEGAGYRNTFGYYTYNLGDEPESPDGLEKNVLFKEVDGSEGGTPKMKKFQIGDAPFPENTVIGFYVVINSINEEGELTEGDYTLYSDIYLNENGEQQFTLMYNEDCKDLILTYEDILLPEGDLDYNDGVFIISDNPTDTIVSTSFDLSKIPLANGL